MCRKLELLEKVLVYQVLKKLSVKSFLNRCHNKSLIINSHNIKVIIYRYLRKNKLIFQAVIETDLPIYPPIIKSQKLLKSLNYCSA